MLHSQNLIPDIYRKMQELEQGKRNLKTEESQGTERHLMKHVLKRECISRSRMLQNPELNVKNVTTAIRTLAAPYFRYRFCIFNWKLQDVRQIRD